MKRSLWILPILLLIALPLIVTACGGGSSSKAGPTGTGTESSESGLLSDLDVLLQHGIDLAEQGKLAEAITVFDKAIELDGSSAVAYNDRGLAHYENGDSDKALADLQKAMDLEPTAAIPYANRGLIYQALDKKPEAIADFEKFISLTDDPTVIQQVKDLIAQLKQ